MKNQNDYDQLVKRLEFLELENELLKVENKKFFSAVEFTPATIVITDTNGKIEYANPRFTEITGYSPSEALGENPRMLKSGIHNVEFYKQLWDTITSGEVWRGEFYNRKKNGEFYWEQAHIAPIIDKDGKIVNFVAVKFDITRKKENEQYLKAITGAIPELIFVMDEDGRYIDVMIADGKIIGYVKDKYVGKLVHDVLPVALADRIKVFISATISASAKQVIEYEIETPSGVVWFEGQSALLDIEINGKKCIIMVAREVTDRKKTEKKLLELNATKDKFFTIMAHDLRNPFGAILTLSKMLTETMAHNELNEANQIAKYIRTSAEDTFDLLENLLQWSRSQTGRLANNPQKLILFDLVENTVNLLESQALNKQVVLSNTVSKNMVVYADVNLSKTILRNLISNAIKFTNPTGRVKISAAELDDFVQISVSDSGIGIPPEGVKKLFRIDSKYSTEGTNKEKGTGLGLILCKEFVELNGGKIWVESKENEGSEFFFTLPKRPKT